MKSLSRYRSLAIAAALLVAAPMASFASVFVSVGFAPPILPVYTQPLCPGDGYLWTPGYWGYAPAGGYYWVPGVWVQPPTVGFLWTPGYWGFVGGAYRFNAGYWGPHVGFYGGINYGFGYGGVGFGGGEWRGGSFFYNRSVANINVTNIHNVYVNNNIAVNNTHASFNGPNGVQARATQQELNAAHEQHVGATSSQESFRQQAASNPQQRASFNGGHPGTTAAGSTRDGFGHANQVNSRQGNQQARINQGVRSGQMTPGETRNVENRDSSIHNQAQADRSANGGRLTGQERQQINQRQNNVSNSIANDKHNANTDSSAAARQGRSTQQVQNQSARTESHDAPHPEAAHSAPASHGGGGEHPRK